MSKNNNKTEEFKERIANIEKDLIRYQQNIIRLKDEIQLLINRFRKLSEDRKLDDATRTKITEKRQEKSKQLKFYEKSIVEANKMITKYKKELQKEKNNDPFSRLYDTSNIVSDEDAERDLEELMRQNPIKEQEADSAIERVEDQKLEEEERLEDLDKKLPTPEQDEYFSEPKEDFNRTPITIPNEPPPPPVEEENEEDLQKQVQQKLHPLATDNDDAIVKVLPQSSSSKITRKTPDPGEIEQNDPKIDLNQGVEGIQMDKVNLNRKQQISKQIKEFKELLEEKTDPKKSKLFKERTGFSETLVQSVKTNEIPKLDKKVCENIFINGSKMNKSQFFPSEFPKLTRIKPITITVSNKKGGRRKTRKSRKAKK